MFIVISTHEESSTKLTELGIVLHTYIGFEFAELTPAQYMLVLLMFEPEIYFKWTNTKGIFIYGDGTCSYTTNKTYSYWQKNIDKL